MVRVVSVPYSIIASAMPSTRLPQQFATVGWVKMIALRRFNSSITGRKTGARSPARRGSSWGSPFGAQVATLAVYLRYVHLSLPVAHKTGPLPSPRVAQRGHHTFGGLRGSIWRRLARAIVGSLFVRP